MWQTLLPISNSITTQGTGVLCSNHQDVSALAPCTHEEADTCISLNISELGITFGARKSLRFIAAHDIAKALDPDICLALPMFHALTSCDTLSSFGDKSKRTAWDTWSTYTDITPAFCVLGAMPEPNTIDEWMQPLDRFVVWLYDCTSRGVFGPGKETAVQ